jgi:hypothetical protein
MLGRCADVFNPVSCSDFKGKKWCSMPGIKANCCETCRKENGKITRGNN